MQTPQAIRLKPDARCFWLNAWLLTPIAILVSVFSLVIYFRSANAAIPDFGPGSSKSISTLRAHWAVGGIVALVRHMERCDRSTAPCLDGADGITARGKEAAAVEGAIFEQLGVQNSEVFTSPTTRTRQTARYMFSQTVAEQQWLGNCDELMFGEISQHKTQGRNLILVTHSTCIEKIQKEIGVRPPRKPAYGSITFISLDGKTNTPTAAEYMEVEQLIEDLRKVDESGDLGKYLPR